MNKIWTPQARQIEFMQRPEYECLYGGAAGGGKSDALLVEALRQVDNCDYIGLILRKTYPQLTELIDRSYKLYKLAYPKAVYNASAHRWTFPSGAQIYFGSMQHTKDRINYQGKRYDYIAFDELTHFTWEEYSYMFSRNRPSQSPKGKKHTRVYMRASTNPGGVGHGWVKERFITVAPPMTTVVEELDITKPDGSIETKKRDRIFVPATIFDNQVLLNNDPNYLASLALLPSADRDALLYGSWDSFDGQVFREWKNNPDHYEDQMWTHVIEPFTIPSHWKIYRCFDWGYTRPYACYWIAVSRETQQKYIIRELYGCDGQPNRGTQEHHLEVAKQIREIEDNDPNLKGRKISGVADPAIFEESHGTSIAADMAKYPNYISFTKGDHSRIAGKMQMHYHLAFNEDGYPMMQIFNTCRHLIRTLPNLVYDDKNVEDINSEQEDHSYDAVRYGLMEMPITPRKHHKAEEIVMEDDPLNMHQNVVRLRRF